MNILITGAGGLIGSEAVDFYCQYDNNVFGIENNQREVFFGKKGNVYLRLNELINKYDNFKNYYIDIRDKKLVFELFNSIKYFMHYNPYNFFDKSRYNKSTIKYNYTI